MKTCVIEGCERELYAKEMCVRHYRQDRYRRVDRYKRGGMLRPGDEVIEAIVVRCAVCAEDMTVCHPIHSPKLKAGDPNTKLVCGNCSDMEHRSASSGKTCELECPNCGIHFRKDVSLLRYVEKSFCCQSCASTFNNGIGKRKLNDDGTCTCIDCDKVFQSPTCQPRLRCSDCELVLKTSYCKECNEPVVSGRGVRDYCDECRVWHPMTEDGQYIITCEDCGVVFNHPNTRMYCEACATKARHRGGVASAHSQGKRSKGEMLFADLCAAEYGAEMVKTSDKSFADRKGNLWDCDISIVNGDQKVAVNYNGVWHLKQLDIPGHNLKWQQAKDKIKSDAIKRSGYVEYIVEDWGSFDERFVREEFAKFKKWMSET